MGKFDHKITVVIGCATGIGNCLAKRFAREGATVVLCDIQEEKGQLATKEICEAGGERCLFPCGCNKRRRNRRFVCYDQTTIRPCGFCSQCRRYKPPAFDRKYEHAGL